MDKTLVGFKNTPLLAGLRLFLTENSESSRASLPQPVIRAGLPSCCRSGGHKPLGSGARGAPPPSPGQSPGQGGSAHIGAPVGTLFLPALTASMEELEA